MKKMIVPLVALVLFSGCLCIEKQNPASGVKIGWAKQEAICPAGAPVRPDMAAPRQVVSLFLKPVT